MKRYLVTGGGGFVGQWMARVLIDRGDEVTLAGLGSLEAGPPILSGDERRALRWVSLDVRSQTDIESALDEVKPDVVVHLAGIAFPPESERDPVAAYDVNVLGCVRLMFALTQRRNAGSLNPTVLVIGTAYQYGAHGAAAMPLREDAEQRPATVYAATKVAQETVGLQSHRGNGIRVICTRSFNHSGVGQADEYLLPSLVRRVVSLKRDGGHRLVLGNDSVRDYLHVTDAVHAYLSLVERGTPGEVYNVASGTGVTVHSLAEDILLRAGVAADISTEASLVRATDIPVLVGSPSKLMRDTGWAPQKTHADIIDDLLHAATD